MKFLNKLIIAFLACSLLFMPLGTLFTQAAFAEHEDDEPIPDLIVEEVEYDPIPAIIMMRDIELMFELMGGVLDSYDGTGHPDGCYEYESYYLIALLFNLILELEVAFSPSEWHDVYAFAVDGANDALLRNEAVLLLCQNGRDDSLSAFNRAAARAGIESGLASIRTAITASAERAGIDPALVVSQLGVILNEPVDQEELEELADLLGAAEWEAELFFEDLIITQTILQNAGGWLDRLIAGETVGCGEYYIYFELLLEPVPFFFVPPEWAPLYLEHVSIIRSYIDSNRELLEVCVNGGFITDFMVLKARDGVAQANDRLHALKQETARRLGVSPR